MIFNLYLHMETKYLGKQVIHPGGGRVGIFTDVEKGHNKKWCCPTPVLVLHVYGP